jgi:lipopolysaccharide transport system permease protein
MWEYRELIRNLAVVELKNRYQNTSLGFLWSLLSPLCMALVLWFVFRKLFGGEDNFALNLMVGLMIWRFFASGTTVCLQSIVSKSGLVTKVYIPRHILVFSAALSSLISALLEFLIILPIAYFLLGHLPWTIIFYPLAHLLMFLPVYGIGLLFASCFVYFRDLAQIWEVLLSILIYASPIIYPVSVVPGYLLQYYNLNPVTQFIYIFRNITVLGKLPSWESLLIVLVFGAGALIVGNLVFNKLQRRFAEEI